MAMAMAKWIPRALAFVKVFAARLECPFAKSSAGCSQSVIQTAPAASSPVCVSLKSIKMLQIKLKVSTFFAPPPSLSFFLTFVSALSRVSARIGTWIRMRMRAWIRIQTQIQIPLRFGFGFICMRNIFKWQLQIFLLHTSLLSSTFASSPFAGNYFLISSLIAGVTPSLSLSGSPVIADKFVKNGRHCCLFTARKLVSAVDPLTYWQLCGEQRAPQWLICMWHMRPPYRQTCHAYQAASHLAYPPLSISLCPGWYANSNCLSVVFCAALSRQIFTIMSLGGRTELRFQFCFPPHSTWL